MTRNAQWEQIREQLRSEYGAATFNSWLKNIELDKIDGNMVSMTLPTRFLRDWVLNNYANRIRQLWSAIDQSVTAVDIRVKPLDKKNGAASKPSFGLADTSEPFKSKTATIAESAHPDPSLMAPLDPRFTFENFVVGKSNELAHAAARRVAEAKDSVPFNPLYLYGGVGLGKTHLMHAIGHAIAANSPEKKVLYLSAEKFMYRFIRALRFKDTMNFKDQFRSVDVLMIDDVQFIAGKDSTQEEFFHTFNALVDQNHQIIISGDRSPTDLEGMEERMRSRLGWGLVADIHPTDYELRLGILQSKVEQGKLEIEPRILEFLAHRITSNVRELEGALNRVLAYSDLVGRAVTLESTQEVLRDLLRANDRRITIEEIQKKVAEHFNIRMSDMHSARRARAVARPRQVAMYLAKHLTSRSLPEIGRKFGGRDHTTVMHALKKIDELRQEDIALSEDIDLLMRMLE
ncbi:chromosomal replication initiator protein DnaA [Sneathiella sp. CAU 1612]|uniref:Chromosomal replication initiator protein DnaA n=1 Tax=Sneathiella sedimenti TaxID=2816034 RepID=A0ABS3F2I3_9PROT|nr:chromosomal replication initiator protein DnaA [Sneathiella sedimenti]MBO0332713.1 chromosomal replication initiator protein DnaA [Sneathiella sedimenti]